MGDGLVMYNLLARLRIARQPIAQGNVAVTMLQLSNIAWETKRELHLDKKDGKILNDPEAMTFWDRTYEKGWAPHV